MWLLVGLGNPGEKYAGHRHNVGFMAVDQISGTYSFPDYKSKFQGLYSEVMIGGEKVALLKPLTFMNESGQSIGKLAKFFKIPPERIIVFHDELDLEPGKIRIKMGGGVAGHNGLKSARAHLGTEDFLRVRIGIGHPGDKNRVSNYVLSDFSKADQKWLDDVLPALADHIAFLLQGNESDFMTRVAESSK